MPQDDRPLTARIRDDRTPVFIDDYERAGGYEALRTAIGSMTPGEVMKAVQDSNLRGRGGAGFPTGQKWSFVPMGDDAPHPKYVVANADEMEPGTFKDRLLMENDPHQLIEGMILAAYATQADVAFVFLRWAYRVAAHRLERAIAEAYERGYLGRDVLGSGWGLDLHLHISAGRYMCGEETGLLNALEGKRANPRAKPPYPQASGAWGKPTVVNNVETLCNVPHIVRNGADWFRSLSKVDDGGTKLYGASGHVRRPGVWELPLGTTLGELLHEHAGGMADGYAFRGLLPGGASTDFLTDEHFDLAMDFNSPPQAGSRLGTGTMIVLDDQTCPVGFTGNLAHFFAQESCGWCTPCWAGLHWIDEILSRFEAGQGLSSDMDRLRHHAGLLTPGHTYCALAPGAQEPLNSALKYFGDEFDRHVSEHACPWGGA